MMEAWDKNGNKIHIKIGHAPQGDEPADMLYSFMRANELGNIDIPFWDYNLVFNGKRLIQPNLPFEEFKKDKPKEIVNSRDIHSTFYSLLGITPADYKLILKRYVWNHEIKGKYVWLWFFERHYALYIKEEKRKYIQETLGACVEAGDYSRLAELSTYDVWGALLFCVLICQMSQEQEEVMEYPFSTIEQQKALRAEMTRIPTVSKNYIGNGDGIGAYFATRFTDEITQFSGTEDGGKLQVEYIGTEDFKKIKQDAKGKRVNTGAKLVIAQRADAPQDNVVVRPKVINGELQDIRCLDIPDRDKAFLAFCLVKAGEQMKPEDEESKNYLLDLNVREFAEFCGRSTSTDSLKKLKQEMTASLDRIDAQRIGYTLYKEPVIYYKTMPDGTKKRCRKTGKKETGTCRMLSKVGGSYGEVNTAVNGTFALCCRFTIPFFQELMKCRHEYSFSIGCALYWQYRSKACNKIRIGTLMERVGMKQERGKNAGKTFERLQASLAELQEILGLMPSIQHEKPFAEISVADKKKLMLEFDFMNTDTVKQLIPDTPEKESESK